MTTQKQQSKTGIDRDDGGTRQVFDPLQLDTLELAAYVLGLVRKGVTTEGLVQSLGRNYSLVGAYLRMFDELEWIEKNKKDGKWALTPLGEVNLPRFQVM